jgi:hypothetical protein
MEYDSAFELPEKGRPLSIERIRVHINLASKHLEKVQKQAMSHRQQSFQDLLKMYEADDDPTTRMTKKRCHNTTLTANVHHNSHQIRGGLDRRSQQRTNDGSGNATFHPIFFGTASGGSDNRQQR